MNKHREMTDNDIFLYGDTRNKAIHLMRCFSPNYGHGDHIHTLIKLSEIKLIISKFNQMEIGETLMLDSIGGPIYSTKYSEDRIDLEGAIFSGGWIVKFCSLRITMEVIMTIDKIITKKKESFFEERSGPIVINGSEWFVYDKP